MPPLHSSYDVIVVGGGVTGASAAHHLAALPASAAHPHRTLLLEAGLVGQGRDWALHAHPSTVKASMGEEQVYTPFTSGSDVFAEAPRVIKMIVTIFPFSNTLDWVDMHGVDGARKYLRLASVGRETEKALARKVLPDPDSQLHVVGSLIVCRPGEEVDFEREYRLLLECGAEVEWWSEERVRQDHPDAGWTRAMFFPHDAVIDSVTYAKSLVRDAVNRGRLEVCEMAKVVDVKDCKATGAQVVVKTEGGGRVVLHAKKVIMATGAFHFDRTLSGILRSCYSYLVGLKPSAPCSKLPHNSPNFITRDSSHDYCMTDGYLRISGEDHYSGLLPPRREERCGKLKDWVLARYPELTTNGLDEITYLHGVYTETPDGLPLVGPANVDGSVIYMVGCNGWGQASMSYVASLAPMLCGYGCIEGEKWVQREEKKVMAEFMNLRRFRIPTQEHDGEEAVMTKSKL